MSARSLSCVRLRARVFGLALSVVVVTTAAGARAQTPTEAAPESAPMGAPTTEDDGDDDDAPASASDAADIDPAAVRAPTPTPAPSSTAAESDAKIDERPAEESAATTSAAPTSTANTPASTSLTRTPTAVESAIDEVRTPVDRLTEHYLGSTSRPVRFDWRNSLFMIGVQGGELLERNNFGSFRLGGYVRKAFLGFTFELGAHNAFVFGTESSEILRLTPYRQAARPPRIEIDANVSYPLFEGVVTPLFDFIPASEMVFSVMGGARYLLYPQTIIGDRDWDRQSTWTDTNTWQEISLGLATAQLNAADLRVLERRAYGGMQVDPALVHTLAGLSFDAYYQPGLFFSTRALVAIPALTTVTGTRLSFFWELSLSMGWAF